MDFDPIFLPHLTFYGIKTGEVVGVDAAFYHVINVFHRRTLIGFIRLKLRAASLRKDASPPGLPALQ